MTIHSFIEFETKRSEINLLFVSYNWYICNIICVRAKIEYFVATKSLGKRMWQVRYMVTCENVPFSSNILSYCLTHNNAYIIEAY